MSNTVERKIYLEHFKAVARAISSYEDLLLLFQHLSKLIARFLKVKGCSIMLFDEREKQLFRVGSYGVSQGYLDKGPLFVDTKYRAFMNGEPVFVKDVRNDPRIQYPEAAAKEGIVSILTIPIRFRGVVTGIMRFYTSELWELHEDDLDSFCALADHLGLVIEYNGLKNFYDTVKTGMDQLPPRLLESV